MEVLNMRSDTVWVGKACPLGGAGVVHLSHLHASSLAPRDYFILAVEGLRLEKERT
jgi:hypothetical protein